MIMRELLYYYAEMIAGDGGVYGVTRAERDPSKEAVPRTRVAKSTNTSDWTPAELIVHYGVAHRKPIDPINKKGHAQAKSKQTPEKLTLREPLFRAPEKDCENCDSSK